MRSPMYARPQNHNIYDYMIDIHKEINKQPT